MHAPRRWVNELLLGVVVAVMLAYSSMYGAVTAPNERSRIYLAVAMVDHGTIAIDQPMRRFGIILDRAAHDGRMLSDKAPGSSFLAAGVYGAVRIFTEPGDWSIHELLALMRRGLMLPLSLLGFFLVRRLMRRIAISPTIIDVTSLGWILGSAAFHYGSAFYGHQIVAVCFAGALLALDGAERNAARRWPALPLAWLAGASAGLAGLTEYQAGIPAVLLSIYLLTGPLIKRPLALLAYALGALPCLAVMGWYHQAAFGGPFELSYHHLENPALSYIHSEGIGGITSPRWGSFEGGISSLHRGLLATSPMFALVLPGVFVLWRSRRRRLAALLAVTTAYYVLFISSSNMWVAGWSFGPRLLVPGMTWMVLAVAAGAQWLSRWSGGEWLVRGAVISGVLVNQAVRAFFPEIPPELKNPLVDVVQVLAKADLTAPNLLVAAGVRGVTSLWPLALLSAVLALYLLLRPVRVRSLLARGLVVTLSLLVPAGLATVVVLVGPTKSEHEREGLERYVRKLEADEPR